MKRLENKIAIVTGGASGLGKAACIMMAKEGAKIAVVDINDTAGENVVNEIMHKGGVAKYYHIDASNGIAIKEGFKNIFETFKAVNVLVNNAGIHGVNKPSDAIEETEWDRVIKINLKSVFLCTKYAVAYMKNYGGGSIVNMSSVYGLVGGVDPPYHASKGGVRLLTKSDAFYYGKYKIRVNSIHPGYIMTPLLEDLAPNDQDEKLNFYKAINDRTLLGVTGEPDDIAHAIVFLASDEAKYITGAEIVVDGGLTAI